MSSLGEEHAVLSGLIVNVPAYDGTNLLNVMSFGSILGQVESRSSSIRWPEALLQLLFRPSLLVC